ncbi:MAG: tetratricopeptide repeat protein [Gemmataceae bacterium]
MRFQTEREFSYVPAYQNCGDALVALKRYEAAVTFYKKAIVINPKNARAWSNLGFVFLAQSRCDDAIKAFTTAVQLDRKKKRRKPLSTNC